MDKPTLKKDIISAISLSTTLEDLKSNSLILLTALGIIIGTPCTKEEANEEANVVKVLNKIVELTAKEYRNKHSIPEGTQLSGSDGLISLKDVVILDNSGTRINLPYLVVFFDQIIGVTFGNIDNNND